RQVPAGGHEWKIRFGFCQTQIQRSPVGGWDLWIPPELLALAIDVDDVVDLWDAMKGDEGRRMAGIERWVAHISAKEERIGIPVLWDMAALIKEEGLVYAMERGTIA